MRVAGEGEDGASASRLAACSLAFAVEKDAEIVVIYAVTIR
jgi:hypothetical protein